VARPLPFPILRNIRPGDRVVFDPQPGSAYAFLEGTRGTVEAFHGDGLAIVKCPSDDVDLGYRQFYVPVADLALSV
jgi:hypothetical protein